MQTVRQPPEKVVFGGKEFFTHPDVRGRDDEVDQMLHALMRRKVFFVTEGGGLGTARAKVERGDEVHAVEGCGFQFVLRRVRRNGGKMAESGVDGMEEMNGEGMKEGENAFLGMEGCTHDEESVVHYVSDTYVHGVTDAEAGNAGLEQRVLETVFIR